MRKTLGNSRGTSFALFATNRFSTKRFDNSRARYLLSHCGCRDVRELSTPVAAQDINFGDIINAPINVAVCLV